MEAESRRELVKGIRALIIAFSMYSRIPMPHFTWKEEDLRYVLCFFPWIGAVVGSCLYLWTMLCERVELGDMAWLMISAAIPLLVTGGFHADGYLDTVDALSSYQPKERKLEILKDAHIGAFALIRFALYGLIYLGALSEIQEKEQLQIVCAGFFLSRVLSGLSVVSAPLARQSGMLFETAGKAEKKRVKAALYVQGVLCVLFMLRCSVWLGAAASAAALLCLVWYVRRMCRELHGVTGDTAGYFVLVCEEVILVITAVLGKVGVW